MKITNSGRGIHQREIPGLEKLKELPDHWQAFTNLDLALPGRGIREIDLVMIIEDRLLLVDLKDWVGPISSRDGNWFNGRRDCGRSPVHKISENVRELTPLLRKFLGELARREQRSAQKPVMPWMEGVVVLTRAHDRSGISGSEVSRVFSVDPFMKMLKNRVEREKQLSVTSSRGADFTSPEWISRFRQFFNVSTGIFQVGAKRYGGFKAKSEIPSFSHSDGIFAEFDVDEEGVEMSSGLLRRWDFTKAETQFQTEEGRSKIVGREKSVIAWLDDRNPNCGSTLLRPKVEDQDRGVAYWEVFERRRRLKRLSEFCATDNKKTTTGERIELARQVLVAAKGMHDLQAAHLDIGAHSIWLELPSTVRLSHLMAASFPEIESLGKARFQFLSSSKTPEDVIGDINSPLRKDVFLLGCVVHVLLMGIPPAGDPPEWDSRLDSVDAFKPLHPWFERNLDIDPQQRHENAAEMLDAFNAALSSLPSAKATIDGLDRFRDLKSQRQVFQKYPESELLKEDERVVIWRTESSGLSRIVKLWKGTALGDITREGPRILSFLERAAELIESPIAGSAALRAAHWTGDAIVIVQDFVSGPTLADEVGLKNIKTSPEKMLLFLYDLVEVVGTLHDRSLAHGDLKPANIVISSSTEDGKLFPTMIDLLDFSPTHDGERISQAYAPQSGGRFERDRFAVTKIAEEILTRVEFPIDSWPDIAKAIDNCRSGPPQNATLLPLKEALDRAIRPPVREQQDVVFTVTHPNATVGPMLSDEGVYWISRFGAEVNIRGAVELLEIRLDSSGEPVVCRRVNRSQNEIQRLRRYEFASFSGHIHVRRGIRDFAAIADILKQPEIAEVWASRDEIVKADLRDDVEPEAVLTEAQSDRLAERLLYDKTATSTVDVRRLWRRMMDIEAELTTEAVCLGDSAFRREAMRHVAPIQMIAGELDFERDDKVTVERQDAKGQWMKIGMLDISASTPKFVAIESWMGGERQAIVSDGNRLRFQSRYENTSRERREAATSRILQGAAAAPSLFNVFQPNAISAPKRISCDIDEADLSVRYGLNQVQIEAFKNILESRPVGLLQGPPGTGKTRFIGAIVHYALTHGLARNVLLASQSHEAVNNAGEAVLRLFGDDRDSLSLIRVGNEGSVSETLRPYHVACAEKAYKDRFLATARQRLSVVANALGLDQEISERVLYFEDVVRPVLIRIGELAIEGGEDLPRLFSLKTTVEQQLSSQGINIDLSEIGPSDVEHEVSAQFISVLPANQISMIERFRQVIQLSRDIVGSVSTWQRSFETFLAGTRHVVAGTCVGLGRTSLGLTKTMFDLVIVDEAARCTSSELAVPIQAGKWVVLVGDQAQLEPSHPATVVQSVADELRIPLREVVRSDFDRVFESSYGKRAGSTLTKQYRMLPAIGRVVSSAFYDRSLVHGRTEPFLDVNAMPPELSKPLVWVSTDSLEAEGYQAPDLVRRGSLFNEAEANVVVTLLKRWASHEPFVTWLSALPSQSQAIGVICAYASQRDLVWKKIQVENFPDAIRRSLKVDTIDSYQGKENLIVLLSLVRNNADGSPEYGVATISPGFMSRKNRINVALSRAMDRLVVIGSATRWRQDSPMGNVVQCFSEELKCDEAMVINAQQLLDAPSIDEKRKNRQVGTGGRKSPRSLNGN